MSNCPKCGKSCHANAPEFGPASDIANDIYDCDRCGVIWDEWGNAVSLKEMTVISQGEPEGRDLNWFFGRAKEVGDDMLLAGYINAGAYLDRIKESNGEQ